MLFAYLAGHVSTISSKTIFAAVNKLHDYQSGVFPPLSFDQSVKNPLGPRVFNPYVLIGDYNNGQFVPNSMGFVNVYTLGKAPAN